MAILFKDGDTTYIVNGIVECTEDNLQLEQWIRVRPETVGQFTGWYDRTKKTLIEICTGDVVKNTFSSEVFIVTWCNINGYYMLVPLEIYKREKDLSDYIVEMKPDFRNLYDYYNTLEVIGNIHDEVSKCSTKL
jgi:hypothetical protein